MSKNVHEIQTDLEILRTINAGRFNEIQCINYHSKHMSDTQNKVISTFIKVCTTKNFEMTRLAFAIAYFGKK